MEERERTKAEKVRSYATKKKRPYEVRDRQPTDDDAFLMAKSRGSDRPHHGRIFRVQVGPSPRTAGEARKRPRPGWDPIARLNLWRALRGEGGGWIGGEQHAHKDARTHARETALEEGKSNQGPRPGGGAQATVLPTLLAFPASLPFNLNG